MPSSSSSSRRHVSFPKVFAKVVGIVPELESEIGLENMDKIFWGDDGIRKIRQSASKISDELRDAEPTLVKSLDKTYQRAKELVARGSSSSGQDEELIASHAQNFRPWVDGARGLERFVSNHHDSERAEVIDEVRDIVVTMSLRGDNAEKIALTYKKHSKVSCAFARITGQADELVVIKGDDDDVVLEEDALRKTRTSSHLDGDRRSRSPKPTGAGRGTSRSRSRSPKSMMSLMNGSSHHNNNNKKPRRPFLQRSISSSRMLPKSSKELVKEGGGEEENGEEKTQQQQTVEKEQSRGRSWFGRSSRSGAKEESAKAQRQSLGRSSSQSPPPRNHHNGLVVVVPKAAFRHSHEELSTAGPPKREEKKQQRDPLRKARSISPVRPSTNKSDQPRRRRRPQSSSQPELDVERLCI